jgi:hypothetical protein
MDVLEERNHPGSLLSVLALVTGPGLLARAAATDPALILPVGNADWMLPALTSSQDRPTLPAELTEEGFRADEGYLGDARPSLAEASVNAPPSPQQQEAGDWAPGLPEDWLGGNAFPNRSVVLPPANSSAFLGSPASPRGAEASEGSFSAPPTSFGVPSSGFTGQIPANPAGLAGTQSLGLGGLLPGGKKSDPPPPDERRLYFPAGDN